ncbi:hypothetical protein EV368DRAFT_85994 [Lentinula lateritia]|nr:hypothetical protein EV368DRAFT_85994 [Lentinula lateritia]
MCRWIVYIGEQGLMPEDLLIKPEHSIVKQVHERFLPGLCYGLEDDDKEELETEATWVKFHGFGVGWYTDTFKEFLPDPTTVTGMWPAHFRTIAPIYTDLAFEQLCAHTASKCILAHMRNASFPPSVEVNNHPFIFGKYKFMHNGKVADFPLFESGFSADSSWPATCKFPLKPIRLTHCCVLLSEPLTISAGFSINAKLGPSNLERTVLEMIIADSGNQMLACRWRDSKNGFPPSLYLSLTAGNKLNRKYRKAENNIRDSDVKINSISQLIQENNIGPTDQGRHVIVGSEPCTKNVNDWGLFYPNQCVTVDETHKLRIIDMMKSFKQDDDTPLPMIGMRAQAINLPAPKFKVFETELYLKKKD